MSTMDKAEVMAKVMADVVKRHVADVIAPLNARIKELEARPVAKDGRDGVSVAGGLINEDGVLILTLTDGALKDVGRVRGKDGKDGLNGNDGAQGEKGDPGLNGKDGPPGRDGVDGKDGPAGRDGVDGKGVDPEMVDKLISEAVAKIPAPKDGKDGAPGKDGRDGVDGKDGAPGRDGEKGLDGKDGRDGLDGKDGAAGPQGIPGEKGIDGKDGRDGIDGKDGAPGERGEKGEAGAAGKDADPHEIADIILPEIKTYLSSNPVFKGEKGEPGRDGRDGAPGGPPGPQGERGESGKSIIDAGVYESGKSYAEGNGVTFGGSFWIAQKDTDEKPGTGDGWRLAVKRGRDGKDAK